MIDLTADIAKANILLSHIKNGAPKVINSTLNRTIDGVRTDTVREITKTYDIKATPVRASMKLKKSTLSSLQASIASTGSPIPLINFRVTPNKPGKLSPGTAIKVSVKRSGGKPLNNDVFIARMSSGHVGIFERVDKGRLPIRELYGLSTPQMMAEEHIQGDVLTRAEERFNQRLDHEIQFLLSKEK